MTRVLTESDALADLNGTPRPGAVVAPPVPEPTPGMAVHTLAGEIIQALLADEKDGGYDLTAGMFGPSFSALVRRWAAAEWKPADAIKDRLLAALERAGQAESALRRLEDGLQATAPTVGPVTAASLMQTRGYHALVQVIYELQQDGQYSDDEGEETSAMIDLVAAIEAAAGVTPTEETHTQPAAKRSIHAATTSNQLEATAHTTRDEPATREAAHQLRKVLGISQDFDGWPLEKLILKAVDHIASAPSYGVIEATHTQPASEPVAKPYAYAVYFPDQPTEELVHDLDDLCEDMTNREHTITPLYDKPTPQPAAMTPTTKAAVIEALETLLAMAEHGDFSTGYCCCGSPVEGHKIGDGHSPFDEGDYYAINAFDKARAALAALRSEPVAGWISVDERLPGEQGCDSEDVMLFINGHCEITDMECRQGGAWGLRLGYFDAEKQAFRVHGRPESFVTHWQALPLAPTKETP